MFWSLLFTQKRNTITRVCGMHTLSSLFLFASHTASSLMKE